MSSAWVPVLLLVAGVLACSSPPPEISQPDRIILVTIDTLRADHLPSYGYPVNTAPFLTSLGQRSVEFHASFAHSATTGPSHASLFTSLYPLQHRVQNNGQVLDDAFVTVAEILSERGFDTAAFVSGNAHFRDSRIAQGFAEFDQPEASRLAKSGEMKLYRPADETTDAVLSWFERRQSEAPVFLWVHYFDPHKPLQPPAEHLEQVSPQSVTEREALLEYLVREHASQFQENDTLDKVIEYDAEIRFVDAELARLFETLEAQDAATKTLWIITSDHGQGLANHRWFGHHRYIYNEQLRVPLVFHFTDGSVEPRVVADQLVEHVDVPATIIDLLGQTLEGQAATIQGRSLVPLLRGDRGYRHKEYAFGERRRIFRDSRKLSHEPGERYALQSLEAKYLLFTEGEDEFYDLMSDPYETDNLIGRADPTRDELRRALLARVAELKSEEEAELVDQETLERLESLGYVD